MKCKCCGSEMKKGYLQNSNQPVQWFPEGKKPSLRKGVAAADAIALGYGSLLEWNGYRADAWLCETCQTVTIPLKTDTE